MTFKTKAQFSTTAALVKAALFNKLSMATANDKDNRYVIILSKISHKKDLCNRQFSAMNCVNAQ